MEQQIADRAKEYAKSLYPDMRDCDKPAYSDCRRDYAHGARDQHQIDNERLEYIVSKWKQEETLWRERYNAIHNALVERQGEYISLELIEEIFSNS